MKLTIAVIFTLCICGFIESRVLSPNSLFIGNGFDVVLPQNTNAVSFQLSSLLNICFTKKNQIS